MSPHRITFVITDLDVGGAERQLVELVTRLPRDEFEPTVIVIFPPPYSPILPERLHSAGIPIEYLSCRSKVWFPRTIENLTARLRELRPALLQGFLHFGNIAAAIAAKRAGSGRVVTGIRVAERRWNLHRLAARVSDHLVARHVCVSQSVADFAATRTRLPRGKLVTIPNGVDVQQFTDAVPLDASELGVPPGRRILAYVGRLDRQKRLHWLLKRMPETSLRLPDHDLVLIGRGPDEKRLRRLAERLGIADHVHFGGWHGEVPRILAATDVLLLTSAWEGMPNVILEAMAAGRPVVATQTEGVEEVLGPLANEPATQLVGANDKAAFVDAVVRSAENASLSEKVGMANRRRVEQEFTFERMVQRYCELYHEILSGT